MSYSSNIHVHACHSMATVKIYTYRLKVFCLRTIKTFGNYIGVTLKQYTCARVPFNGYRENSKPTLKVLKTITLCTIKTFGDYIGVILKQYTCTRVPFNGYRENSSNLSHGLLRMYSNNKVPEKLIELTPFV